MWFFLCLFFILLCFAYNVKLTKQEIAEYYGVSKKTLGKWVEFCCPKIVSAKWEKIRKLNILEATIVLGSLGTREDYEVLTKGEILQKCETYYHTVRQNIALNVSKLGIDENAYSSMDKFPPKLSHKIVQMLG